MQNDPAIYKVNSVRKTWLSFERFLFQLIYTHHIRIRQNGFICHFLCIFVEIWISKSNIIFLPMWFHIFHLYLAICIRVREIETENFWTNERTNVWFFLFVRSTDHFSQKSFMQKFSKWAHKFARFFVFIFKKQGKDTINKCEFLSLCGNVNW